VQECLLRLDVNINNTGICSELPDDLALIMLEKIVLFILFNNLLVSGAKIILYFCLQAENKRQGLG
jgi:hypothetical protein